MEDGPDAVLTALGHDAADRVPFDLEAPVEQALRDGLPRLAAAVADSPTPCRSSCWASARLRRAPSADCSAGRGAWPCCGSTPTAT
jgi:hypothetical protein